MSKRNLYKSESYYGVMTQKFKAKDIGGWVYTLGVVLALLVGLVLGIVSGFNLNVSGIANYGMYASIVLVLFGIALGFLNVSSNERVLFLLAGATIIVANSFVQAIIKSFFTLGPLDPILSSLFSSLSFLFVPATVVVALKVLFSASRV